MSLDAINVPASNGQAAQGLIVLLHGWGANAQDLVPLASMLDLPAFQFLFPDAPFPHLQAPPGCRMWYDLIAQDAQQLATSRQKLKDWLASLEHKTGIPANRTILGGFSQGGAMTLDVGLPLSVAGLVSLSGYLHPHILVEGKTAPPVLMAHGKHDSVVPLQTAQQAKERLTEMGVAVEYQEFEMGHEIRPEVLDWLKAFVTKQICNL